MMRKYILLSLIVACSWKGYAQKSYNEQVLAYIEQFKDLAVAEQKRTGVPAAIKLAQGIHETAAGNSELCQNAQNHFGIKCKTTWTGETYTYTDDAKDECFRKYTSAQFSYIDHSDFLKNNKRYSSLFNISPTDYAAWAHGLKRCGYATNPHYAKKIIKTIEDFRLQEYTYAALSEVEDDIILASAQGSSIAQRKKAATNLPGEYIPDNDVSVAVEDTFETDDEIVVTKAEPQEVRASNGVVPYYQVTTKNGMKGFYARKGDMLLEYAIKNRIRYAKILEYNDLPDAPLEADMFIYLEKKAKAGSKDYYTVANGESLLQISQQEGVQLQQLRQFNHLEKGEEPVAGTVLNLRFPADSKPGLYPARKQKQVVTYNTYSDNKDNYVSTRKNSNITSAGRNNNASEKSSATSVQETTGTTYPVNIANEKPIEETIAEEQSIENKQDASQMTPLEKLKAHMDKTVYASEREFEPKSSLQYSSEEAITTTPASKTSSPVTKNVRPAAAAAKPKIHTVRKGETLFGIANKYNTTVSQLQKINKLGGGKKITTGMKLKLTQ